MAPPPSKRQKRRIVVSSDEEEDAEASEKYHNSSAGSAEVRSKGKVRLARDRGVTTRSLPTRSRTKPITAAESRSATPVLPTSSRSSSEEPPHKPKRAQEDQKKGSLHAYFNTATQAQQLKKKEVQRKLETPVIDVEEEDLIEDGSLDELQPVPLTQNGPTSTIGPRIGLIVPGGDRIGSTGPEKAPTGSQSFLKPARAPAKDISSQATARVEEVDSRPWAERFAPSVLEELVVHKKKVADVRNWLERAFLGRERKRLLILKGPSGAGKTATMSTLAYAMDFEVTEWKNPINADYSSKGYLSVSAQFEDFLGRSGNFASLTLVGGPTSSNPLSQASQIRPPKIAERKVILLEEFPSTFPTTSAALRAFRSNILQHLAATLSSNNITPIILIITETPESATTASNDSFTAHRLLGWDILTHPSTTVIEFNPVAPTLLTKALDLVIQKEARLSGRRRVPGPSVLKRLGEVGDVRNAIGSLEFLCLRGDDTDDWGGRVASKGKKGVSTQLTKMEKETLEMVSQRENSLGIFHAVGKVVYNKRDPAPAAVDVHTQNIPDHLSHHTRSMISQVSPDDLLNETGTDISTFIAVVHENYILSCESPSFTDHFNGCIDALSGSDLLSLDRGFAYNASGGRGAAESLRQDEIAFQIAVRGLLVALPYPVKRRAADKGRGAEAFKMSWPTSLRISRRKEEVEALVEAWYDRLRFAGNPQPSGHGASDGAEHTEPVRTNIPSTKDELILERLPYAAKISPDNSQLEAITKFGGVDKAADSEGVDGNGEGSATTKARFPKRNDIRDTTAGTVEGLPADGKLYLSDDDIVDD